MKLFKADKQHCWKRQWKRKPLLIQKHYSIWTLVYPSLSDHFARWQAVPALSIAGRSSEVFRSSELAMWLTTVTGLK